MVVGTNMVIVERNGYRYKVSQAEIDDYLKRYEDAKVVEGKKSQSKSSKKADES